MKSLNENKLDNKNEETKERLKNNNSFKLLQYFDIYKLIGSISVFIVFIYVFVCLLLKHIYIKNGYEYIVLNNPLIIIAIILGVICAIIYLPIVGINIYQFVNEIIKNKQMKLIKFIVYIYLFLNYLVFFITSFCFAIYDISLFFVIQILMVFTLVADVYLYLDNTYEINWKFLNEIDKRTLSFKKNNDVESK